VFESTARRRPGLRHRVVLFEDGTEVVAERGRAVAAIRLQIDDEDAAVGEELLAVRRIGLGDGVLGGHVFGFDYLPLCFRDSAMKSRSLSVSGSILCVMLPLR